MSQGFLRYKDIGKGGKIPWRRAQQPTPIFLPENPMDSILIYMDYDDLWVEPREWIKRSKFPARLLPSFDPVLFSVWAWMWGLSVGLIPELCGSPPGTIILEARPGHGNFLIQKRYPHPSIHNFLSVLFFLQSFIVLALTSRFMVHFELLFCMYSVSL